METKLTLLVLAVVAGLLYTLETWINISHWLQSSCNMASNNPILMPISWITWGIFTYTTWIRGIETGTILYWFMIVIWGASNLYFTGCMWSYWFG